MNDRRLLLVLAGVFAVLAALLVVLGLFVTPVAALVALPFAAVAYLLWYHATGRLEERARTRAREREFHGREAAEGARGGRSARARAARERTRNASGQQWEGQRRERRQRARPRTDTGGMSVKQARKVLAVDASADESELRVAYRERVKEVHPDRGGSEEAFQRVQQAYDRLRNVE